MAWDVAILDDGIVLIEGNRSSDIAILQVDDQPLLVDKRSQEFMTFHSVVR